MSEQEPIELDTAQRLTARIDELRGLAALADQKIARDRQLLSDLPDPATREILCGMLLRHETLVKLGTDSAWVSTLISLIPLETLLDAWDQKDARVGEYTDLVRDSHDHTSLDQP
jgi:hypothetical protein